MKDVVYLPKLLLLIIDIYRAFRSDPVAYIYVAVAFSGTAVMMMFSHWRPSLQSCMWSQKQGTIRMRVDGTKQTSNK